MKWKIFIGERKPSNEEKNLKEGKKKKKEKEAARTKKPLL